MNKIMQLVDSLITASTCRGPTSAFAARIALQAEVTRMEAEIAQAKEDFKILQGHFSLTVLEQNALSDKLAGLAKGRQMTEVWSVSSKVFSVLFATEAQADRFIAGTTATMGATKNRLDIAQPAPEPVSQYGSHELQALIVADLQKEPKP